MSGQAARSLAWEEMTMTEDPNHPDHPCALKKMTDAGDAISMTIQDSSVEAPPQSTCSLVITSGEAMRIVCPWLSLVRIPLLCSA
jgi:hypothetical protein